MPSGTMSWMIGRTLCSCRNTLHMPCDVHSVNRCKDGVVQEGVLKRCTGTNTPIYKGFRRIWPVIRTLSAGYANGMRRAVQRHAPWKLSWWDGERAAGQSLGVRTAGRHGSACGCTQLCAPVSAWQQIRAPERMAATRSACSRRSGTEFALLSGDFLEQWVHIITE